MKKLMIAAVAIAMTFAAQAVTIKWGTAYEVCDGTGSYDNITTATMAYLIDANVMSQTEVYNAVMGGATLDAAVAGNFLKNAGMTDGKISTVSFDVGAGYAAGDTLRAYMVLFAEDKLYFTEEVSQVLHATQTKNYVYSSDSSIDAAMADMSTFDTSVGGWVSTAAVPEPTSGLLLLLGMAGLALKRKQA